MYQRDQNFIPPYADTCIHSIIRQLLMTENATPHPELMAKHSTNNTQYHVGLLNSSNT